VHIYIYPPAYYHVDPVLDQFEKACSVLGGVVESQSYGYVCKIHPHEKGTVSIVNIGGHIKEIYAENETASTSIRIPFPGAKIKKIVTNEKKKMVFVQMDGSDSCTLYRQPRIVRASCVLGGRIVEFSFDP